MTPIGSVDKTRELVYFVGAGPGDPELITVKGKRLLSEADVVVYAGSLVNPSLLELCRKEAELIDSAPLDLDGIMEVLTSGVRAGKRVVRLHSGDPSLYGAIGEQMLRLREAGVGYEVVPGVSSLAACAAALKVELTAPGVSQTVIITRAAGRTPVPESEDIARLAEHGSTMAIFLSSTIAGEVQEKLLEHYGPETPAAVVKRASWPDQEIIRTTVGSLASDIKAAGIDRSALILVGGALAGKGGESLLYAREFSHGFRRAEEPEGGGREDG